MRTCLIAAVMLAAPVVAGAAPQIAFDQGIDARKVLAELRGGPRRPGVVPAGIRRPLGWAPGCREIVLAPGQSASEPFSLVTSELIEDCEPPYPVGSGFCRVDFGSSRREIFRLVIEDRDASAAPERFRVCLHGYAAGAETLESVHRYRQRREGQDIVLTPSR